MNHSIKNLVVNGCSYTVGYASGGGHNDLADRLGIPTATSLAIGGSANSRILRTTLKHSYQATEPTLYVVGITFISRMEVPILKERDETTSFEGRWCNPQNQEFSNRWEHYWSRTRSQELVDLNLIIESYSLVDRTEDLMYRMLAAIADIESRGHRVLMYQQADDSYDFCLDYPRMQPFKNKHIVNDFRWRAVVYQHEQGVEKMQYGNGPVSYIGPAEVPEHIKHPAAGQHQALNDYLYDYIVKNNLLV